MESIQNIIGGASGMLFWHSAQVAAANGWSEQVKLVTPADCRGITLALRRSGQGLVTSVCVNEGRPLFRIERQASYYDEPKPLECDTLRKGDLVFVAVRGGGNGIHFQVVLTGMRGI